VSRNVSRYGRSLGRVGAASLAALTMVSLAAGAIAAPAASARPAKPPAVKARPHVYHPVGHVHAKAARVVNFRERAKAWRARHHQHVTPPRVSPFAAFTTAFDGISQGNCSSCFPHPSVTTSANGAQILETTGGFVQVFDKNGTTLCDGGLATDAFLGLPAGTAGSVQVQYDDVSNQFILTAIKASGTPPTVYIAATTNHDACGAWHVSTLVLSGGTITSSSNLGGITAGQDTRAILFSAGADDTPQHLVGLVFAVSKAAVYAGSPLSTALFEPADAGLPVTMAGSPMIDSPNSYFLDTSFNLATGDTGYTLLTMTGSGSAQPTLTSTPLGHPELDFGFALPVFDGSRIWFATEFCNTTGSGPCSSNLHYGYVTVADDSMTFGQITAPAGSDDSAPTIAVDPNSDGTASVFLDWLNVVELHGQQTDLVKSFIYPGGPLPDDSPLDQVVATGNAVIQGGAFTAAAADPGNANGACAVTNQVYFRSDSTWTTRIRRKCGPANPMLMPSVIGDTRSDGVSAVQAAGFPVTVTDVTTAGVFCNVNTAGTIFNQDPPAGPASSGVSANLFFCDVTTTKVPDVQFDSPAQAVAALQAAGLTEGSIIDTTNCSAGKDGLILATAPAIGTPLVTGTQVSLEECTNTVAVVPDVTGETPGQATEDLQDAGLTVGSTSFVTSCNVPAGTIDHTSPPKHDDEPVGTVVRLFESTGRPANCP
jgi:beta-lactam-binding protein with PASTA domain